MSTYEELHERSLTQEELAEILAAIAKLNSSLGLAFDGVLRYHNDKGEYIATFWMDTEAETWMYDPVAKESDDD